MRLKNMYIKKEIPLTRRRFDRAIRSTTIYVYYVHIYGIFHRVWQRRAEQKQEFV